MQGIFTKVFGINRDDKYFQYITTIMLNDHDKMYFNTIKKLRRVNINYYYGDLGGRSNIVLPNIYFVLVVEQPVKCL